MLVGAGRGLEGAMLDGAAPNFLYGAKLHGAAKGFAELVFAGLSFTGLDRGNRV